LPYTLQWNVAFEHELGSRQSVSLTYIGADGRRLIRNETLVNPNPTFQTVNVATNTGDSDYHALQVQYQKRLSAGIQALASYTWSKCFDTGSGDVLPGVVFKNIVITDQGLIIEPSRRLGAGALAGSSSLAAADDSKRMRLQAPRSTNSLETKVTSVLASSMRWTPCVGSTGVFYPRHPRLGNRGGRFQPNQEKRRKPKQWFEAGAMLHHGGTSPTSNLRSRRLLAIVRSCPEPVPREPTVLVPLEFRGARVEDDIHDADDPRPVPCGRL
jgi:hypothetical protein